MIFYLENGEITESGTHNDLINQKWKYYKMIELQSWF
jgi:ABC-type multidrug transport system fused ATPase/permease subunit